MRCRFQPPVCCRICLCALHSVFGRLPYSMLPALQASSASGTVLLASLRADCRQTHHVTNCNVTCYALVTRILSSYASVTGHCYIIFRRCYTAVTCRGYTRLRTVLLHVTCVYFVGLHRVTCNVTEMFQKYYMM